MAEYLDILDGKGEKTGEQHTYEECHEKGLIHKAAHVWLVNQKGQILLQKRSLKKKAYPGLWDISAAGHVSAGQTGSEAAKRETEEELGISLPQENFKYLFSREEHIILNEGTYINNEFQDIFLVRIDEATASKIKSDPIEVDAVRWLSLEDFKKWIAGQGEEMVDHTEEYKKLLEYIK